MPLILKKKFDARRKCFLFSLLRHNTAFKRIFLNMLGKLIDIIILNLWLNMIFIVWNKFPKTERPTRMTELRPISLCNVGYKIISKVLCQRLKYCLLSFISETQSAFVAEKLISDNIQIAHEMFHRLRTNKACKRKYMAIKTDMSKTYDIVEWSFIYALLQKMGFDPHWVN